MAWWHAKEFLLLVSLCLAIKAAWQLSRLSDTIWLAMSRSYHRVETYRDVTDRCKHCGRLRYHVPTFFQATGRKMINCACSASLKWVVIRSSSNQMHASSNLPSMRTKKVGTLVTSLYVSTLWRRFRATRVFPLLELSCFHFTIMFSLLVNCIVTVGSHL
jgi:hypothetical protein